MPICKVIIADTNGSERRCRNYACKGLECCSSHRKFEVENEEIVNIDKAISELKKKAFAVWKSKYYSIICARNRDKLLRKSMREYDTLSERYSSGR